MPTYNEEEAIKDVVEEWHQIAENYDGNLAVINDGSTDSTLRKLHEFRESFERLIIIDKLNTGHGQSCVSGYKWANENNYEWVFQTDSDGQASTKEFADLWKLKEKGDFVFGNRPSRGDGFIRFIISRVLQLVLFAIFFTSVKDANVPYRLMRTKRLAPHLDLIPEKFFLANALLSVVLNRKRNYSLARYILWAKNWWRSQCVFEKIWHFRY